MILLIQMVNTRGGPRLRQRSMHGMPTVRNDLDTTRDHHHRYADDADDGGDLRSPPVADELFCVLPNLGLAPLFSVCVCVFFWRMGLNMSHTFCLSSSIAALRACKP